MKKLILAAALLAATGLASAQTVVYGQINQYYDSTKTGTSRVNQMTSDLSRLGFKASENLGNGLSARAVIETSVASQDPTGNADSQLGSRQSTVGLAHNLGSVDMGRQLHSTFLTISDFDAFGTLIGTVAQDVHNYRALRLSNGTFVRVNPIAGLSATWEKAMNATADDSSSMSVGYNTDTFGVGAAQFSNSTQKSTVLGASVKLGGTKVLASRSQNTDNGTTVVGNLIGVQQELGGPLSVRASYGTTDADKKAYNVGLTYAMSKTVKLDGGYRVVDAAGTSSDIKQLVAGVRYAF